jgi:hypothetical protein
MPCWERYSQPVTSVETVESRYSSLSPHIVTIACSLRSSDVGLSSTERAKTLIALAHPEFRDGLTEAAKQLHLV